MNNDLVSFFEELANRLSGFQWKMDYEEAKYSPEVTSECGGHGIYNGWLRINVWAELSVRGKGKYHWSITAPPQALFPNQPSLQIATRLFSTPKILIHVDQIAKFMQQTDAKYGTLAKEHFGRKLEKLLAKYGYSIPAPEAFKDSYGNTVCIVQEPEWDSEQILKQAPELNLKVTDEGAFEEFVTLEGSGSEVLQKVEEALIKIMPQEEFEDSSFDESLTKKRESLKEEKGLTKSEIDDLILAHNELKAKRVRPTHDSAWFRICCSKPNLRLEHHGNYNSPGGYYQLSFWFPEYRKYWNDITIHYPEGLSRSGHQQILDKLASIAQHQEDYKYGKRKNIEYPDLSGIDALRVEGDSSFDESFDWSVFGKYAPIENR